MGAFKLGKMTFGSLFKKPETVLYPLESKPKPAGLKGHIVIDVNNCILCGACDRGCAADCIDVDKQSRQWKIDRLGCIQCGYCITVCPKNCLSMSPDYAPATTVHEMEVIEVPEQDKGASDKGPEKAPVATEQAVAETASVPEPTSTTTDVEEGAIVDDQVAALLGRMDEEKASKVKDALSARA